MDCENAIPMLLNLNSEGANKSISLVNMVDLEWDETTYVGD